MWPLRFYVDIGRYLYHSYNKRIAHIFRDRPYVNACCAAGRDPTMGVIEQCSLTTFSL